MNGRMQNDKMLTLRLPESVYDKLSYIADQEFVSVSHVARKGIRAVLQEHEDYFTEEFMQRNRHHMPAY